MAAVISTAVSDSARVFSLRSTLLPCTTTPNEFVFSSPVVPKDAPRLSATEESPRSLEGAADRNIFVSSS